MAAARLVHRRFLDPREAHEAARQPIPGAVNIPFSELPDRLHELPPREQEVRVVGPPHLVRAVVAWLESRGRRGRVVASGLRARRVTEAPTPRRDATTLEIGRLWEPNAFLREVLPQLPCAAALDLACGTGRDAIFMSSCGWDVTAVDLLPDALSRARELAARYAAALQPIHWLELDLETGVPQLERRFELITAFRYLHRPLFARLRDWLRPGGSLLCETFTTIHQERHGRPARAAHVLRPGELTRLLAGFEVRHESEGWRGWAHTARVWAVLP